jgi:hypothetical protein
MRTSDLEVVNCPLEDTTVSRVGKVTDVDDPNKQANDGDDLCERVSELVQLSLEGCLFGDLARDGGVDGSDGGSSSGVDDDGESRSIDDGRSLDMQGTCLIS